MHVKSASLDAVTIPLVAPYHISYRSITSITSDIIRIAMEDGQYGIGEAVALPGYSTESQDQIHHALVDVSKHMSGQSVEEAIGYVNSLLCGQPFARSAVLTALELAMGELVFPSRISIPLVAPLSSGPKDAVLTEACRLLGKGFRTLKVKIGRDVNTDVITARTLMDHVSDDVKLRFDANQGYSRDDLLRFVKVLDHPRSCSVEYIEQPFVVQEWDTMKGFCRQPGFRFMLDESICDLDDLSRAADIGVQFVKLKLYKHAGISHTLQLAQEANRLGLRVVFGNGVSTDVGNMAEALLWSCRPELFHGAFEGNGFA